MSSDAEKAFEKVRAGIDQVDSELVKLIARRLKLTGEVGKLKAELELPLYVPEREIQLINEKRKLAEQANIPPDLVEDVLRRIMRESYVNQSVTRSQVVPTKLQKVVVIGGGGQLGSLFVRLFEQSGYQTSVIEKDRWENNETQFRSASLVLVAVPIRATLSVIQKLSKLNSDCILADITSVKQKPLQEMLKIHKGPVVGLHPMFGPGINNLAKQTIVVCHGREEEKAQWLIEQLELWGANLSLVDSEEHDHLMSIIQVLRHFSTVAYGFHLMEENIDLEKVLELSSPIYRLELIMVGRLFAQNSELYSDIIFSDKQNIPMVRRFINRLNQLFDTLQNQDKEEFAKLFGKVSNWFDDKADMFLEESNQLLEKASDIKK